MDNVATHHANLIDSELLPTLNADNTSSSFMLLIDLVTGTDMMPL
ncbi:MAG: hypothetical protein WCL18_03960 [bacterium]